MRTFIATILLATLVALPAHATTTVPDLDAEIGLIPDDQRAAVRDAFMEEEPFLDGTAWSPRPSREALTRMQAAAAKWPRSAAIQAFLAEAAESAGDHAAAEKAWRAAILASAQAPWTIRRLATFYAGRLLPEKQVATLDELAAVLSAHVAAPGVREQLHGVYDEVLALADTHALEHVDRPKYRRAIIALFPDDPNFLHLWIDELVAAGDHAAVRAEIDRWEKTFPAERRYFTRVRAGLLVDEKNPDAAIALWRQLLVAEPEAPDAVDRMNELIDLLDSTGRLADEVKQLTARQAAGGLPPNDFAELFAYYLRHDHDKASPLLADARDHHPPTDERELLARAHMHLRVGETTQAIRYLTGAARIATSAELRQTATFELGHALLAEGTGRVALTPLDPFDAFALDRVDTGPSIPGGLASLVFHQQWSPGRAEDLTRVATIYLNGLRAEQILASAETEWPQSPRVAQLAADILAYYRSYQRDDAVIALAGHYLATWPDGDDALAVEVAKAQAQRHEKKIPASDITYKSALARADKRTPADAERIFDEYVAVLLAEHRETDVVALYWKQIERHPHDPGGYEKLNGFLGSVRLYDEELKVYQKALAEFKDQSWNHKIARWTITHKGEAAFRELTKKLLVTFSGTEAESYLAELVEADYRTVRNDRSEFYEAIYKMALARFPFRPALVRALLALYDGSLRTSDADALCARYAAIDPELRQRLIVTLGKDKEIDSTLARLANPRGRAERLMAADLLVWTSRQEDALPLVRQLLGEWPADADLAGRAANLEIASAPVGDLAATRRAVAVWDGMAAQYPAVTAWLDDAASALAEIGELPAAKQRWDRMILSRKGDPEIYVQVAAAYWDWFLFDDAAHAIETTRSLHHDPLLYWDKQGSIYESAGDTTRAAREYVLAFVDATAGGSGHSADEDPATKLDTLVKRHKEAKEIIRRTFIAASGERPKDSDVALAYTRWLRAADLAADSRKELAAAVERFATVAPFLTSAAADARGERWTEIAVDAQQKLLALDAGKPARVLELAAALEAAGRDHDAEVALTDLAARLAGNGAKDTDMLVDVYGRIAEFLVRHHRDDESLVVRRKAADVATGDTRDGLLLDLGWRLAALERFADAEVVFRDLRQRRPENLDYLDAVAEMVTKTAKDPAAAAKAHLDLYTTALKDARALKLGDDESRNLVTGIRRSYIQRLEAAGSHVDAIDQWIEIISRQPDREDLVADGLDYARRHGQIDRYLAAFTKTAAKSFKDVRWPLVIAEIDARIGKPAEAAAALDKALEIRPDRLELRTRQIAAFISAGDFAAADKAYAMLDKLSDHDPGYLLPHAWVAARLGQRDRVIALVETYVTATAGSGVPRFASAADALADAGLDAEALVMYGRGLDEMMAHPYTSTLSAAYLDGAIDAAVRVAKTKDMLATIRLDGDKLNGLYQLGVGHAEAVSARQKSELIGTVLSRKLLAMISDSLDADAAELLPVLDDLIAATPLVSRAGWIHPLVQGGLVERGVALAESLRLKAPTPADARSNEGAILGIWRSRRGDRALLAELARNGGDAGEEWFASGALTARRLGDTALERQFLARAWDELDASNGSASPENKFDFQSWLIARSLELAKAANDRAALERIARRGGLGSRQVIEWLFDSDELDLARVAIDAAADKLGRPRWWRAAVEAVLRNARGDRGERTHQLFQALLARRTIGDSVGQPLDKGERVADKTWFSWAWTYATVITKSPAAAFVPRLADYAAVAVEEHPTDESAYERIGELFLARKDDAGAERFYRLAAELDPKARGAIDGVARAQLMRGDRKAALATWKHIADENTDEAILYYAAALDRSGLHDEARTALRARLEVRYALATPDEGVALASALAGLYPAKDHGAGGPVDQIFRALLTKDRRPWLVYGVLTGNPDGYTRRDGGRGEGRDEGDGGDEPEERRDDDGADAPEQPPADPSARLLEAAALEPYFRDATILARAAKDLGVAERWQQQMIDVLLGLHRFDRALAATEEMLAQHKKDVPFAIVHARAAALIGLGKIDEAAQVLADRIDHSRSAGELKGADEMLIAAGQKPVAARLTLRFYMRRGDVASMTMADWLAIADAQLDLGDTVAAVRTLESFALAAPRDTAALAGSAALLEERKLWTQAIGFRQKIAVATPSALDNALILARDRAAAGDQAGALDAAILILGDRRARRTLRDEAGAFIGELGAKDAALAGRCVGTVGARAMGTPSDEATWLALAACQRAAGDSVHADAAVAQAVKDSVFPAAALVALGAARLAAGDARMAEPLLERAVYLSANMVAPRIALYHARRALGIVPAAVGALAGPALDAYEAAGMSKDEGPAAQRIHAVHAGALELGPAGVALAAEAAEGAEQAGDWAAASFYHELAAEAKPGDKASVEQHQRATAARAKAHAIEVRGTGSLITFKEES